MLKKIFVAGSLSFLSACSSTPSSDYATDAVTSTASAENGDTQITGKKIIPIDLFEQNLNLKVSSLFITATVSDDATLAKSTVSFEIEYQEPKTEPTQTSTEATTETDVAMNDKESEEAQAPIPASAYTKVILNQRITPLEVSGFSKECDDEKCVITQDVSFEVDTQLLVDAQKDGFAFYLEKESKTGKALGTMIPARYLSALFSK